MLAKVIFEVGKPFFFVYKGKKIYFESVRWNRYLECWIVDYSEDGGLKYQGMPIRSGVNLVQGIGAYLPSLYAVNQRNVELDPERGVEYTLYVNAP